MNDVTVNTSLVNLSSGAGGSILGYSGAPGAGNLYCALAPVSGTDTFGNTYASGLTVLAGSLQGVSVTGAMIDSTSTLIGTTMQGVQVLQPSISGGTAASLVHVLNNGSGQVLGYTTTTSASTYSTNGQYLWTAPTGVTTVQVLVTGGGGGGGGGSTVQGGDGGGAGEYASELSYTVVAGKVYLVTVGKGGKGGAGGQEGSNGGLSSFVAVDGSSTLVQANGGTGGVSGGGGSGATGSKNTVHFNGGNGGAQSGQQGGNGGGSAASSAGQGNAGQQSTSSTGGSGGAAVGSGGAGGAGGNTGVAGANGSAPGGAGGGAGNAASANTTLSKTYTSQGTYCYYGSDATNGSANQLRNHNGPMYQSRDGNGSNTGHQVSYMTLPFTQIQTDMNGMTVTQVKITLRCLSSYYTAGVYVNLSYTQNGSFGNTVPSQSGDTFVENFLIGRGQTLTHDLNLNTGLQTALQNGNALSLKFGPITTGNLTNYNYYGYYDSGTNGVTPSITLVYHPNTSSGPLYGGNGADGQVVIIITSNATPTFNLAVSSVSTTDPYGNAFAAGFTGPQLTLANNSSAPSSNTGATSINANTAGTPIITNSHGLSGSVSATQTDVATFTLGNSTSNTALTKAYTIPANDAQVGTVYVIEVPFNGTMGNPGQVLNVGVMYDGSSFQNIVPVGTVIVSAVSHGFAGAVKLILACTANGVSGSFLVDMWGVGGDTTLNRGNTPGMAVLYGHSTKSLDTTVGHTISVAANWAGNSTGETVSGQGSVFSRNGP